jgi:hypothetical protein
MSNSSVTSQAVTAAVACSFMCSLLGSAFNPIVDVCISCGALCSEFDDVNYESCSDPKSAVLGAWAAHSVAVIL